MTKNIIWPDLIFPPINLYNLPKQVNITRKNKKGVKLNSGSVLYVSNWYEKFTQHQYKRC